MDINSLEPNSHKYRQEKALKGEVVQEKHKLQKVISGTAKVQKKNLARRFVEIFFAGDMSDVKSYLIFDVIVPSIRETFFNMINKGSEMMIFGESTRPAPRNSIAGGTRVSYQSYGSQYRGDKERITPSRQNRMIRRFDDICFESRGDAEQVIDILMECISMYGQATVSDLYDAAGISTEWTDNTDDYGWKDLSGVQVIRVRNGYILDLPKCTRLDS